MADEQVDSGRAAERGALAAALAKAQVDFPAIPRTRTVNVRSTSGTYSFDYAPLDVVLEAVRVPLAENGLAITQLLSGGELVTLLLHEGGGVLESRIKIPLEEGQRIQQLGSAITYLRRYSLLAILGISSEDDDDGAAEGTQAIKRRERGPVKIPRDGPGDVARPSATGVLTEPAPYPPESADLARKNAARKRVFAAIPDWMRANTTQAREARHALVGRILGYPPGDVPPWNKLTADEAVRVADVLEHGDDPGAELARALKS
jgi:hypothetical protein